MLIFKKNIHFQQRRSKKYFKFSCRFWRENEDIFELNSGECEDVGNQSIDTALILDILMFNPPTSFVKIIDLSLKK